LAGKPVSFCLQAQFHDDAAATTTDQEGGDGGDPADSRWLNPTRPWLGAAWVDVAALSFYSPLPPAAAATTSCAPDRCPAPAVAIPDPADETDFSSAPALEAAVEARRLGAEAEAAEAAAAGGVGVGGDDGSSVEMTDYLVYCVTGDRLHAGTGANVSISIVGPCCDIS